MKTLKNKRILITGGGRGIGAASALRLSQNGATCIITSRTESELNHVANQHPSIIPIVSDISKEDQIQKLFDEINDKVGGIDILINNAATIHVTPFEDLSLTDWNHMMNVNITGAFLCSQHAFKLMKKNGGGQIINISSLSGIRGVEKFPGFSGYITTKHAIIGLTESLQVEGKAHGIRTNCIAPGAVDTKMLHDCAPGLKTNTTPEDIADTVNYLCSTNTLNGAIIEVHSNL